METKHQGPVAPSPIDDALRDGRPALREEHIFFGSLGRDAYLRYAPAPPNNPSYAIEEIRAVFGNPSKDEARRDRATMWEKYDELVSKLESDRTSPLLDVVYAHVREHSPLATEQLTNTPSGLGKHLREITSFGMKFLLTPTGESRFPALFDDRQADLLANVAAPMHDVLKYLGSYRAQVPADHEVLTAELLTKVGAGHRVDLRAGESRLTQEDVRFLAGVIGNHENLYKAEGRSNWARSGDVVERGRAVFAVMDTLTGAIVEAAPASDSWKFDAKELDARFVDLYFRHLCPMVRKAFAPEWGARTIRDLTTTFEVLAENGAVVAGVHGETPPRRTLAEAGLEAIRRTIAADANTAKHANRATSESLPLKLLTPEEHVRIEAARVELTRLIT